MRSGILLGNPGLVISHVSQRLGVQFSRQAFGIGTVRDDEIIGGTVYDNYRDGWIEMHCAGRPGWLTRQKLRLYFGYPFKQLGCRGVMALTKRGNKPARKLIEGLGWKRPYAVPEGFEDDDMIIYTMLRRECRWIGETDGQG